MKAKLLAAYERELKIYRWAQNPEHLARFMATVEKSLKSDGPPFEFWIRVPTFRRALQACGLPGYLTAAELRALPD